MPTAKITGHRLEKAEERLTDKAAEILGYSVVRFSQPRNTMQTHGIPDRLYCHPGRGIAVWAELKSERGRVSPHQQAFHAMLRACGHEVLVGTADAIAPRLAELLRPEGRA